MSLSPQDRERLEAFASAKSAIEALFAKPGASPEAMSDAVQAYTDAKAALSEVAGHIALALDAEVRFLTAALEQAQNVIELMTDQGPLVELIPFEDDGMEEDDWRHEILGEFDARAIPRKDGQVDLSAFIYVEAAPGLEGVMLLNPEYAASLKERRAALREEEVKDA